LLSIINHNNNVAKLMQCDPVKWKSISFFYCCIIVILFIKLGLLIGAYAYIERNNIALSEVYNKLRIVDSSGYIKEVEDLKILLALNRTEKLEFLRSHDDGKRQEYKAYSVIIAQIDNVIKIGPIVTAVLINCLSVALISILARLICSRFDRSSKYGNLIGILISIWPPVLVMTFAVMRDVLTYLSVFVILYSTVKIIVKATDRNRKVYDGIQLIVLTLLLLFGIYMFYSMRPYVKPILIIYFAVNVIVVWLLSNMDVKSIIVMTLLVVGISTFILNVPGISRTYSVGNSVSHKSQIYRNSKVKKVQRKKVKKANESTIHKLYGKFKDNIERAKRKLLNSRSGFSTSGGLSNNSEKELNFKSFSVGLINIFLFPYPWEDWPQNHADIRLQYIVKLYMFLWYLFLVGILWGAVESIVNLVDPIKLIIIIWAICLLIPMIMVVTNYGTLFRLRDFALLPLFLVWTPKPYILFFNYLKTYRIRSV
jgi:hypothetical protein